MSILSHYHALKAKLPPMPSRPPTHTPNHPAIMQLSFLVGFAALLHFKIAALPVALFALFIYLIKAVIVLKKWPQLPKLILILLTIISVGLIIYVYKGWSGQRAGISFLVLLSTLKFLEAESLRDYYVTCLLLYFLAASSFLFDSSIISISLVVMYTIGLTSILLQITDPNSLSLRQAFKTSTGIILKALPLAVFLFFFFPRIQGSFGFIPSQDQRDINGLSDALVAGEMASSAFNNSLAFRVEFTNGVIPSRSELYWRVKTMSTERLFQWELTQAGNKRIEPHATYQDNASLNIGKYEYQILHERSQDFFLPYLDYVVGYDKGLVLSDYSVFNNDKQQNAFSYLGTSTSTPSLNNNEEVDRVKFLQTESRPNARVQALLEKWRTSTSSDEELVKMVYQHFSGSRFSYTLVPPSLDEFDPIGDFLLNTQAGYCEHYASAFTIIMRWLRIPARVVVGYQGGTAVNNNQFLEVRYSDAHAWSEVWLNGQWSRVDPTAAISPDRIEFGMDALMELWGTDYFNNPGSALSDYLNPTGAARILKTLNDQWKNVGYQWNKWVVNYDFNAQKELLNRLGFTHKNSVMVLVLIMSLGALAMMLLYFWQLIPKPIQRSELQQTYLKFVMKFNKHGLVKNNAETPLEFSHRAIKLMPHLKSEIQSITKRYYQLRYADRKANYEAQAKNLAKQIKEFKITN